MASDPSIFNLANQPSVPLVNPLDLQLKRIQIRNALAAGSLQDQQIQGGDLALDQQRLAMKNTATRNAAFQSLYGSPAPAAAPAAGVAPPVAPGGAPGLPPAGLPPAGAPPGAPPAGPVAPGAPGAPPAAAPAPAAAPVARPRVPTLGELANLGVTADDALEMNGKFQKLDETAATIQKTRADADKATQETKKLIGEQVSSMASMLVKSMKPGQPVNPQLLAWHLQNLGSMGPQEAQQAQAIGQHIAQLSPDEQLAFLKSNAGAPETITANAAEATAAEKTTTADREAEKQARGEALSELSAQNTKAGYRQVWDALKPNLRSDPAVTNPDQWTPATPAYTQRLSQSGNEQVTTAQTASHNAAQEANENRARNLEAQRIGIERSRLTAEQAGAPIADPEYMRGVVSGEIQVNPRDKNFAMTMKTAKAIDPTFTSDRFANRAATTHDFVAGTNAKKVQSINQVLAHMGELQTASDNLGTNLAQYGPNWIGKAISKDVVRYHDANDTAGAEIATMLAQGQATQAEGERTIANLQSANPKTRRAGVDEYAQLLGGRAKAIMQTYSSGTGDKFPVDQYLDSDAVAIAKSHGVDFHAIADKQAPAWMRSKSAAPAAAAPAATPAAAPAGLQHMSTDELFKQLSGGK